MPVTEVNANNWEEKVTQSELPVLVDFWAAWCGPCKMVGPVLEALAIDNAGKINIYKLNVDENKSIAIQYGVRSIPTLTFFKGGSEIKRLVGAQGKEQLQKVIDDVLA
ncbi:MAG: thioredoxin [Syntrophomonadaceae bacterium]|jgi:thioredoxin 1